MSTKTQTTFSERLRDALDTFVAEALHEFITEGEAKQILFCLTSPNASRSGQSWAIRRVRQLARDARIVDSGDTRGDSAGRPAEYKARKAEKALRDRELRAKMRGGHKTK